MGFILMALFLCQMIQETTIYDEMEDRLIVKTSYDNSDVLRANQEDRNNAPETGRYKGDLVHVGRIAEGDVVRLRNMGYNLLTPDLDELRRALLYIQAEEPWLLTKPGKPIAKRKVVWR